jgi:hypothetical protein
LLVGFLILGIISGYFFGYSQRVTQVTYFENVTTNIKEPKFVNVSGIIQSEDYIPTQISFMLDYNCGFTNETCNYSQFSNLTSSDGQNTGNDQYLFIWSYSVVVPNNETYGVILTYWNGSTSMGVGVADLPINSFSQDITDYSIRCSSWNSSIQLVCGTFNIKEP